jgi:endonuclease/exonuclease/phosphatase family metal-dependent hydrolase
MGGYDDRSGTGMNDANLITLASLNLHGGLDSHGRPYDVAAACTGLKADVIALQEVWRPDGQRDVVTDVAAAAGAAVRHRGLASRVSRAGLGLGGDWALGSWGLAVLSTFPVTGYAEIELGRAPGDPISRAAQVITVTLPGGAPLRIVNAHLTHRYTSPVQLALLACRLAGRPGPARTGPPPAEPTIIAGDLNLPRAGTLAAAGYRDVVRGRTFPALRPLLQLDHLLIRGRISAHDGEVLGPVGSDHRPVRAQFSVG